MFRWIGKARGKVEVDRMLWLSREGERAATGADRFARDDVPAVTEISCRAGEPTCYLLRHAIDPCRCSSCLHRFCP